MKRTRKRRKRNPVVLISFVFYDPNLYLCKKQKNAQKNLYQVYDVHFYFYFFLPFLTCTIDVAPAFRKRWDGEKGLCKYKLIISELRDGLAAV